MKTSFSKQAVPRRVVGVLTVASTTGNGTPEETIIPFRKLPTVSNGKRA